MFKKVFFILVAIMVLGLPLGCEDDDDSIEGTGTGTGEGEGETGLEIAGDYEDDFTDTHAITDSTWTSGFLGLFNIVAYSNEDDYLVAQNDAGNEYGAELWSRFDWVYVGDILYYCQAAYDAATQADAEAVTRPDDSDPATTGCGGAFPWTKLTEVQ